MMRFAALVIAIAMLFSGCAQQTAGQVANNMGNDNLKNTNAAGALIAAKGDTVSVYYTGKLENGTVFDSNVGKQTLDFTVGAGQMIAGFDAAVVGMKEGEEKTVTLSPAQAYGEWSKDNVMDIPLSNVGNSVGVKLGSVLNGPNGLRGVVRGMANSTNGTVLSVDFNPELAGKTLIFSIKMVKITKK